MHVQPRQVVEKLVGGLEKEPARLQRALDRQRQARLEAESIAEKTTRELYANNQELERRAEARTHELRETNQRLEAEVAERRSAQAGLARHALEQEVIGEIGRIISSSLDIDEVYEKSAEQIKRVLSFDRISIALVDGDRGTLTHAYVAGVSVPGWATGDTVALDTIAPEDSVGRRALISGDGHPSQSPAKNRPKKGPSAQSLALDAGLRSGLRVPLLSKDKPIGALNLRSRKPDAYSARDAELADRVGTLVAQAITNAGLYAEVQREAREREILAAIGRIISSSVRIEDVYEPFVEEVRKLIPFERIGIFTVDLEKGGLTVAYIAGFHVQARRRGMVFPLAGTVSEEVLRARSGLLIQPQDRAELTAGCPSLLPLFDAGLRSFLTVPLISRNEAIGTLALRSTEPNRYSERDLALAERIGSQIAGAIANSQLYAERERAEQRALALRDIAELSLSDMPHDKLVQTLLDRLISAVDAAGGVTYLLDKQQDRLLIQARRFPPGVDFQPGDYRPGVGFTRRVLSQGTSLVIEDVPNNPMVANPWLRQSGIQTVMSIPLKGRNETVGVVNLYYYLNSRTVFREELATAESAAHQVAEVIERARLVAELNRANAELRQGAASQEALKNISELGLEDRSLDELLEGLLTQVVEAMGVDAGMIRLYDEGQGLLIPLATVGPFDRDEWQPRPYRPGEGFNGKVLEEGKPVIILDVQNSPLVINPRVKEMGIQSIVSVPLKVESHTIGTLALLSLETWDISQGQLTFLELMAERAAHVIERSRLLESERHRTQELVQSEAALRRSEREARRLATASAVVAEIGRIISSSVRIEDVYEPFVEEVRKLIPFERIGIFTVDPEKRELTVTYLSGLDVQARRRGTVIPLDETFSQEIVRARSGLLVQPQDRAELAARFPLLLPLFDAGLRSFLTVPLISRNEAIGILALRSTEPNRYSERDVALAERIGSQIAGAIVNSQLYVEREGAEKALKRTTTELERSNAELEQFAYIASHDLQEPLRMVSSYTQLLARRYRGQLDSDADDFIAFAVDGAERMQTLIRDLLAYSRVGSQGSTSAPTSLDEVFDTAVANLHAAIQDSGAEVTRDPLPTLSVDASQLTQLFQNLIGNALKFRREVEPRVRVAAEVSEQVTTFSVSDNGIGIEPGYLDRIFDIFQRLHTRDEYPGTGIGLAICRRIVEHHHGRIWVESEPGVGTTFYFTLPPPVPTESTHAAPA